MIVGQPTSLTPAPVRAVQRAIAEDVRARCADLHGFEWADEAAPDGRPAIILEPGAGALLTVEAWQDLSVAAMGAAHPLRLPLDPVGQDALPRTAGTCFAVAGGADLLVLTLHPGAGPAARAALDSLELDARRVAGALRLLTDRDAEVALIGPLSSRVWQYIEDQVACRARVYADGDARHGGLAAALYQRAGPEQFVAWLRSMVSAVFLDTRQFLAGAPRPSEADYFWSDLGRPDAVEHSGLRRLTEIALHADLPIVLGGPTLLNGGMYALVEAAWRTGPDVDRGYRISW
jgi:hypothetical protein